MDHDALIADLQARNILQTPRITDAFYAVDRGAFVPIAYHEYAYDDIAIPLGPDAAVSAPHMVAQMTEAIAPQPGDRILEVGTGSGYQAAILAETGATVYTIEIDPELAERACDRLSTYDQVTVITGDGRTGLPDHAPYDGIMVTAAAERIEPALLEQLAVNGVLVAPEQYLNRHRLVTINNHPTYTERSVGPAVRFVPLRET